MNVGQYICQKACYSMSGCCCALEYDSNLGTIALLDCPSNQEASQETSGEGLTEIVHDPQWIKRKEKD